MGTGRVAPLRTIIMLAVSGLLLMALVYVGQENSRLARANRLLRQRPAPGQVALFFLKSCPNTLCLQPVLHHLSGRSEPHLEAVTALLAGPAPGSPYYAVFPKGARVLGLEIEDGLAVVNLNQTAARLNVGAAGEALVVAALVNTLTKFPDVYRVKILIEGQTVESLAGHVDLTQTFRYNDQAVAE